MKLVRAWLGHKPSSQVFVQTFVAKLSMSSFTTTCFAVPPVAPLKDESVGMGQHRGFSDQVVPGYRMIQIVSQQVSLGGKPSLTHAHFLLNNHKEGLFLGAAVLGRV